MFIKPTSSSSSSSCSSVSGPTRPATGRGQRTGTCGSSPCRFPFPLQPDDLVRWGNLSGRDRPHQPAAKDSTPFYVMTTPSLESQEGQGGRGSPLADPTPPQRSRQSNSCLLFVQKGPSPPTVPTTGVADDPVRSPQLALDRPTGLDGARATRRGDDEWACVTGLDRPFSRRAHRWSSSR